MAGVELSVVVLCYRAEADTAKVVEPLHRQLAGSEVDFELVLVANTWPGSDDTTPEHARALAERLPRTRVVALEKQGAMGWDMRSGLARSDGEYLVVIDGDGQVPVEYALDVYRALHRPGVDVVKGRRYLREDGTIRGVNSLVFNSLFVLLFGTWRFWDINGRPKGFTRAAYERLDLQTDDWFTDAEIVLKARRLGFSVVEIPVRFLENEARPSFVNVGSAFEFLRNMIAWRLGLHRAQRPVSRSGRQRGD